MFHEAERYFREICKKYSKLILVGDINLQGIKDWSNPISECAIEKKYIELFQDLGLRNLINQPTHELGNILYILLTNQPGLITLLQI